MGNLFETVELMSTLLAGFRDTRQLSSRPETLLRLMHQDLAEGSEDVFESPDPHV